MSEERIIAIPKERELDLPMADVRRKHGVSDASIYTWKAKQGGMDVSEARLLKTMEVLAQGMSRLTTANPS